MLEGCVTVLYASVIFGFACFGLHVVNYVDSLWSLLCRRLYSRRRADAEVTAAAGAAPTSRS